MLFELLWIIRIRYTCSSFVVHFRSYNYYLMFVCFCFSFSWTRECQGHSQKTQSCIPKRWCYAIMRNCNYWCSVIWWDRRQNPLKSLDLFIYIQNFWKIYFHYVTEACKYFTWTINKAIINCVSFLVYWVCNWWKQCWTA